MAYGDYGRMEFNSKRLVFHLTIEVETDDGYEEIDLTIPAEFEVCGNCSGKGTHVNRAIDGNGLDPDMFHQDPSFAEDYFGGVSDVQCDECSGRRVMPSPNLESLSEAHQKLVEDAMQSDADYAAECEAERRMGC